MGHPHPIERSPVSFVECECFILPGIQSDVRKFTVDEISVMPLDFYDWHLLEKSQFADDLGGAMMMRPPLFCVFSSDDSNEEEDVSQRRSKMRALLVERLTNSIRLVRSEPIYNPTDFLIYRRVGSLNRRSPGLYGRFGHEMEVICQLKASDLPEIEGVYLALRSIESGKPPLLTFALHLFAHSYDLSLVEPRDQSLLLLGCLEVLGGKKLDRLEAIPWTSSQLRQYTAGHRKKRNLIAHGVTGANTNDIKMMREMVRALLWDALSHEIVHPGSPESVGPALIRRVSTHLETGPGKLAALGRAHK